MTLSRTRCLSTVLTCLVGACSVMAAAPASGQPASAGRNDKGSGASAPLPEFRPSDVRPRHDDKKLAERGIRVFESRRLKLYTDIEARQAEALPRVIDAAYDDWTTYFGPLPPNRERTDFQVTGYLMADKTLFREAGLLPEDLPEFLNGRHRGAEFWMNQQKHDYYRRHLLIHEATHCYMTILGGRLPPLWYVEGMAELFGTHHVASDGKITFRTFPQRAADYAGHGRITIIRDEIAAGRGLTLDAVEALDGNEFLKNESYGWSWGLCEFLEHHPRWREPFRSLARNFNYRDFDRAYRAAFDESRNDLRAEWTLFASTIHEGIDFERAAVRFADARPIAAGTSRKTEVRSDRGCQSTGLMLEAGVDYEVTATGRVTLATTPKPWISEPQGVTIRYVEGHPTGQLLGWISSASSGADRSGPDTETRLRRKLAGIPFGPRTAFRADQSGALLLRVNDRDSELGDNKGDYQVQVKRSSK
ncbi:MAG: hypothetical protein IT428_01425 [Planctomycetaceae bacterium]|nr:hypothetical protein [Planctomycetaceae bacterium]